MPLSEREQRLLDEMERSLYQNDADFVSTVSQHRGRPNYTILIVGILIALAGIGTIVTGVIVKLPLIGVLGFVIVFVGALLAISPPKGAGSAPVEPMAAPPGKAKAGSFMDRMNERWDRRQDDRGN